jgi:hypothetical protein
MGEARYLGWLPFPPLNNIVQYIASCVSWRIAPYRRTLILKGSPDSRFPRDKQGAEQWPDRELLLDKWQPSKGM